MILDGLCWSGSPAFSGGVGVIAPFKALRSAVLTELA